MIGISTMPDGGVWMPKVGNKYAVFGIQLPDAYICDNATRTGASWDVFKEAAKYLYEHENKEFTFTGTLDGIWAKKRWLQVGGKIVLGGFVNFTDNQFHPEGSLIRMVGIKRYVNNPYSPEIELSNSPVGTSISSELNKIETNEVTVDENHKKAQQFTKRYFRDAKETMEMLAGSLLNFSGAINPITVATMQMLVGDESLQYRFVDSKTNPGVVNHVITYNSSTKVLHAPSGIIQRMMLGLKTLSNTHAAGDYKYWDMAEYYSPSLIEPEKKFYLYAKCSKDNQSGTFRLEESAIGLEDIADYYHLLVGILNSENNGERSFATLYGFTEILPGRITTDKIVSSDGTSCIDLLKSEISFGDSLLYNPNGDKTLHIYNANISGNIYTPLFVITESNWRDYLFVEYENVPIIDWTKTGMNVQINYWPDLTPDSGVFSNILGYPVTEKYLGCEANVLILNAGPGDVGMTVMEYSTLMGGFAYKTFIITERGYYKLKLIDTRDIKSSTMHNNFSWIITEYICLGK